MGSHANLVKVERRIITSKRFEKDKTIVDRIGGQLGKKKKKNSFGFVRWQRGPRNPGQASGAP